MWILRHTGAALTAAILSVPLVRAQFSIDPCIQTCINQSTDDSCSLTDIKCICRESDGKFLPDLVLCMHSACDPDLDVSVLLSPLELACDLAGTPISQSAIDNAVQEASSLDMMTTVTVTQSGTNVAPTPVGPATASATESSGQSVVTVTASAASSTTATTTADSHTQSGTGSAGGALSTTSTSASNSDSSATTGVSAESTTGTFVTSTTSTTSTSNPETTNSSPFQQQSVAGQDRVGSMLGLVVLLTVVGFCL